MKSTLLMTSAAALILTACTATNTASPDPIGTETANNDAKVDIVKVADIQSYSHPDFFYVNSDGHMVFAAPNKALTTPNSSNTRSDLPLLDRYMRLKTTRNRALLVTVMSRLKSILRSTRIMILAQFFGIMSATLPKRIPIGQIFQMLFGVMSGPAKLCRQCIWQHNAFGVFNGRKTHYEI